MQAESLFDNLESVAFAVEGTDLSTIDETFVPTSSCIQDTKKRQLVTRSGLPKLTCCVCHLHHERAMDAPAAVRQIFVLQNVKSTKICTIA